MGTAILDGLIATGMDAGNITVSTKTAASAAKLVNRRTVKAFSIEESDSANSDAVENADVVIVAVKPAYVLETLAQLNPSKLKRQLW